MLGIRGLDPFGLVHAVFGLASVILGCAIVLLPKGSRTHRRVGLAYTAAMLALNGTALFIYDLFGGFGAFHWLALLSLATLAAGVVPVRVRQPACWLELHGRFMSWSYAGVMAAFAAEIATRVPGVGFAGGVVWPTLAVMGAAAVLIHVRVPRIVERLRAPEAALTAR